MRLNNLTHGIQALLFSWEQHDEKLSTALNAKESVKIFRNNQFKMFYGVGFDFFFFQVQYVLLQIFIQSTCSCPRGLFPWCICISIIKYVQ